MLAANVPSLRLLPDDAHPWNVLDLADPLEGAPPTPTTIPRIIYSVSRRIATKATQFTQSIPNSTGPTACSSIALYTATSLLEGSLVLTAPHHVASAVEEGCWWDQERRQAHPNHPLPPGHLFSPLGIVRRVRGCIPPGTPRAAAGLPEPAAPDWSRVPGSPEPGPRWCPGVGRGAAHLSGRQGVGRLWGAGGLTTHHRTADGLPMGRPGPPPSRG